MAPKALFAACCAAGGALALGVQKLPNEPSFVMTREINSTEGDKIEFTVTPGCKTGDQYGTNDCEIPWGTSVTFISLADFAEPLHRGDIVKFSAEGVFKASDNAPLLAQTLFTGSRIHADHECGLCEGTCTANTYGDNGFKAAITTPTFIKMPGACKVPAEKMPRHLNLGTFTFQTPPFPKANWELMSGIDFNVALTDKNGRPRAAESVHMRLTPGGGRPSLLETDSSTQTEKTNTGLSGSLDAFTLMTETSKRMTSFIEELDKPKSESAEVNYWKALGKLITDSATRVSLAKAPADELKNMKFKLAFKNMKPIGNKKKLEVFADKDCTKDVCKIPLGKKTNMSGSAAVKYTLPKGSVVDLKLNIVFNGAEGHVYQTMMEPIHQMFPMKLPACGDTGEVVTAVAKTGRKFRYTPPPCGDYTFELFSPPQGVFFPAKPEIAPQMPAHPFFGLMRYALPFDITSMELPPFLASLTVDVFHSDHIIPIANVDFKIGLE